MWLAQNHGLNIHQNKCHTIGPLRLGVGLLRCTLKTIERIFQASFGPNQAFLVPFEVPETFQNHFQLRRYLQYGFIFVRIIGCRCMHQTLRQNDNQRIEFFVRIQTLHVIQTDGSLKPNNHRIHCCQIDASIEALIGKFQTVCIAVLCKNVTNSAQAINGPIEIVFVSSQTILQPIETLLIFGIFDFVVGMIVETRLEYQVIVQKKPLRVHFTAIMEELLFNINAQTQNELINYIIVFMKQREQQQQYKLQNRCQTITNE